MKKSGTCPKCSSTEIKENTYGGMGNIFAGRIYRCNECGFSEIWQTKADQKQILMVYVGLLGIVLVPLIWMMYKMGMF